MLVEFVVKLYKTKPFIIEAAIYTGDADSANKIIAWIDEKGGNGHCIWEMNGTLSIPTLEGVIYASPGDMIIRGMKGEFYPCHPEVFQAKYEEIVNETE